MNGTFDLKLRAVIRPTQAENRGEDEHTSPVRSKLLRDFKLALARTNLHKFLAGDGLQRSAFPETVRLDNKSHDCTLASYRVCRKFNHRFLTAKFLNGEG
jgi:hypothetical protein